MPTSPTPTTSNAIRTTGQWNETYVFARPSCPDGFTTSFNFIKEASEDNVLGFGTLQVVTSDASEPGHSLQCDSGNGMSVKTDAIQAMSNNITSTINISAEPWLTSSLTLATVRQDVLANASGFSVAMWFTPSLRTNTTVPILKIGSLSSKPHNHLHDLDGCTDYALMLAQYERHLLLRYQDGVLPDSSCRTLLLDQIDLPKDLLSLLVLSWNKVGQDRSELSVQLNRVLLVEQVTTQLDTSLRYWPKDSVLQIFPSYVDMNSPKYFQGALHQISFFNIGLSAAKALDIFDAGVLHVDESGSPQPWYLKADAVTDYRVPQLLPDLRETDPMSALDVPLQLGGQNVSTPNLPLAVELLSLPNFGVLHAHYRDSTGVQYSQILTLEQAVLPIPTNTSTVSVFYTPLFDDYFNVPSVYTRNGMEVDTEIESFDYRLVAVSSQTDRVKVVGASIPVTQVIGVVHTNHPPKLRRSKSLVIDDTNRREDHEIVFRNAVFLDDAADFNLDRVRVDVWASSGRLTLTSRFKSLADFDTCSGRTYSAWQCNGDGMDDRNMTFAAFPGHVGMILKTIVYDGFDASSADKLVVRVSDGVGGDCLSKEEHERFRDPFGNEVTSVHRGCFQQVMEVDIPAEHANKKGREDDSGIFGIPNLDFKRFGVADLLFWIVVLSIGMLCCCCVRRCIHCMARGAQVHADDDDCDDRSNEDYDRDLENQSRSESDSSEESSFSVEEPRPPITTE